MPLNDFNLQRMGLRTPYLFGLIQLSSGTAAGLTDSEILSEILTAYKSGSFTVTNRFGIQYANTPGTGITTTAGDFKTSLNWEGVFVFNRIPIVEGQVIVLKDGHFEPAEIIFQVLDAPSLENLADSDIVDLLDSDGEQLVSY